MENPVVLDRDGLRRYGIRAVNSTLLKWEKDGLFVRRFRIGQKVFWDRQAVEAYLARRAEEAQR